MLKDRRIAPVLMVPFMLVLLDGAEFLDSVLAEVYRLVEIYRHISSPFPGPSVQGKMGLSSPGTDDI